MSTDVDMAKKAIYDILDSRIKTVEAKLGALKAKAATAKANAEIKLVTDLLTKKQVIHQKLRELKKSGGEQWEHTKADLEARIADIENSVKGIESKSH